MHSGYANLLQHFNFLTIAHCQNFADEDVLPGMQLDAGQNSRDQLQREVLNAKMYLLMLARSSLMSVVRNSALEASSTIAQR